MSALRSLYVLLGTHISAEHTVTMTALSAHNVAPELSQVPNTFWAKSKYDVGLIRNAETVVITPESDYQLKKYQYPLEQEALDGIRPVVQSLPMQER